MKKLMLWTVCAVALAACDRAKDDENLNNTQSTQSVPQQQGLTEVERAEIADLIAQRLEALRSENEKLSAEREAEIRQEIRAEVEAEYRRKQEDRERTTRAESRQPVYQRVSNDSAAGYELFYEQLAPHGAWLESPDYGFVWRPNLASERTWRPYLDGQWVWTERGWTWVSNEPFGWATYHYGRWVDLEQEGWVWVPGTEWAPAWVSWRSSDTYVGWAPLPPETLKVSVNVKAPVGEWVDGYYDIGPASYTVVPVERFVVRSYREVVLDPVETVRVIEHTRNVTNITVVNHTIHVYGPTVEVVERRSRDRVRRTSLRIVDSSDQFPAERRTVLRDDAVEIFAPRVVQRDARPREVQRRLVASRVDTGWNEIQDEGERRRLRAKFQDEAKSAPKDLPKPQRRAAADEPRTKDDKAQSQEQPPQPQAKESPAAQDQPLTQEPDKKDRQRAVAPAADSTAPPAPGSSPAVQEQQRKEKDQKDRQQAEQQKKEQQQREQQKGEQEKRKADEEKKQKEMKRDTAMPPAPAPTEDLTKSTPAPPASEKEKSRRSKPEKQATPEPKQQPQSLPEAKPPKQDRGKDSGKEKNKIKPEQLPQQDLPETSPDLRESSQPPQERSEPKQNKKEKQQSARPESGPSSDLPPAKPQKQDKPKEPKQAPQERSAAPPAPQQPSAAERPPQSSQPKEKAEKPPKQDPNAGDGGNSKKQKKENE